MYLVTWVDAAASRPPDEAERSEAEQQRDGQQDHQSSQFDLQHRDVGRVCLQRHGFPAGRQQDGGGNSPWDRHV